MKPTLGNAVTLTTCFLGMLYLLCVVGSGKALWWVIHPVVTFVLGAAFLVIAIVAILTLILLRRPCRHFGWDIDRNCWIKKGLDTDIIIKQGVENETSKDG